MWYNMIRKAVIMVVLLFGISNVGKSSTGRILASKLGFDFYDLDDEVKKVYRITLEEFVNTGTLKERDCKRCKVLSDILNSSDKSKVIAVTPISNIEYISDILDYDGILSIELKDSAENIFDRLVFSDENDIIYKDDEYKNKHKNYYMEDIIEDQKWYGSIYSSFCQAFDINGDSPENSANRIISEFNITAER